MIQATARPAHFLPTITRLRNFLKQSPRLVALVRRLRRWLWGDPARAWQRDIERALRRALQRQPQSCFVQVGANDGVAGDPLHKTVRAVADCRGVLIEPVPSIFARLRENYAEARFQCLNVAIADESGERDFFVISPAGVERLQGEYPWIGQIGSLRREHLAENFGGIFAPYVVSIKVPARRLDELLASLALPRIDVLHVDAEGYDHRVLRTFDWQRYHPAVVLFEHQHLSADDLAAATALLMKHGYRLHTLGPDTLAVAQ